MQDNAITITPASTHLASVIWLHGLGADGNDFVPILTELGLPKDHGIKFIFPHAPIRPVTINSGMQMRAWYDVREADLTRQEDESSIIASAEILHDYIDEEIASGLSPENIIVAGFSRGGAISLKGGLTFEMPLGGILALSTYLPLPDQLINATESTQSSTPIIMMHGIFDPLIPVQQGKRSYLLLKDAGYRVNWYEYPMQHAVCLQEINDIGTWIRKILLPR